MRTAYVAALGLVVLYGMSLATGALYTLTGFVQSDTCWLVKLGEVILNTHSIPSSDPLSFTLPLLAQTGFAQPFVMYQWLSEVFFALAFRLLNLNGLLLLSANIAVLASISSLFRLCYSSSKNLLVSFGLVILATVTVSLRFMVRPEIFTLLLIVVWLFLLRRLNSIDPSRKGIDYKITIALTLAMIVWCNLHSGFVIGLVLLLVYAISHLCLDKVAKRALSQTTKTALVALAACSLSTLLNPSGWGLWAYLPRVFFLPMNLSIPEVRSISGRELLMPVYYPFFVLIAVSTYAAYLAIKTRRKASGQLSDDSSAVLSVVVILIAVICSILSKRLAAPLSLILASETASLFGILSCSHSKLEPLPELHYFRRSISILALELPIMVLATVGVLGCSDRLIPLTMPQAGVNSNPTFQSVEFILDHWHGGNIFNSAQLGSVLTMYGPSEMKVFIDTRLDVYGDKILNDYDSIIDASGRWKELLDYYRIDWVVVKQPTNLEAMLRQTPGWTKEYEDPFVVIFKRAKGLLPL